MEKISPIGIVLILLLVEGLVVNCEAISRAEFPAGFGFRNCFVSIPGLVLWFSFLFFFCFSFSMVKNGISILGYYVWQFEGAVDEGNKGLSI